ncbi:metal-dependent transcriptional regulator [Sphingobacterium sp. LRF_L2]|uniref:metal-dependent transcriptional regulator n=1 Tax=Sphingobacterium sp. LRF_L2 TaxID=3369421 RepID=UPI003F5D75E0
MISSTEENYLKILFALSQEKEEVSINELSQHLQVKMPTVTSMMKRLSEKCLVVYESYRPTKLTPQGRKIAASIVRKHRLTEMYLVEKMGFGWDKVHVIAEQIEHIQSIAFFDRMDELLGYPQFDPHGSPIPDVEGLIKPNNYRKLSQCVAGECVRLKAINDSSEGFLTYLTTKDLSLGTEIKILNIESFDGNMTVSYKSNLTTVLSKVICDRLLIF